MSNTENKLTLSEQEIGMGLMIAKCTCCGNAHKAHIAQNACSYSMLPNYGCKQCQGIPKQTTQAEYFNE